MQCRVCGQVGEITAGSCSVCGTPFTPPDLPRHLPVPVPAPTGVGPQPPPSAGDPDPRSGAVPPPPPFGGSGHRDAPERTVPVLAAGPDWAVVGVGIGVVALLFVIGMVWRSGVSTPPPDPNVFTRTAPPITATTAPPPPALAVPPGGFSPLELRLSLGAAVMPLLLDGCGTSHVATGVAVAPNYLLTASDVARLDSSPSLQLATVFATGRTIGSANKRGLAVVEVRQELTDYLGWVEPGAVEPGLELVVIGYEDLGDPVVAEVTVEDITEVGTEPTTARVRGEVREGMAGAPAVTQEGRIAGLVTSVNAVTGTAEMLLVGPATESFGLIVADPTVTSPECGRRRLSVDTFGDDPELDELYLRCEAGDPFGCDELYSASPAGSDYELFARRCGDRREDGRGYCAQRSLGGWMPPPGEPQDPFGRDQPGGSDG